MKPTVSFCLALCVIACNQADPSTDEANPGGGGAGGGGGTASGYFPLGDGSTWVYRHNNATTGTHWDDTVQSTIVEFEGRQVTKMQDDENSAGEYGEALHVREGGQVLRIHKDVTQNGAPAYSVDYDPGFLRWDDVWAEREGTYEWSYTRHETDVLGVQKSAVRNWRFTVLSTSAEASVPAGTFDCVHIERVRLDTQETKQFWFADGVGKVLELNVANGNTEELLEYQVD
jgi:hypothetical protein